MCAINPKHEMHFTLSVYTSLSMSKEEFEDKVRETVLTVETTLNSNSPMRWHIGEDYDHGERHSSSDQGHAGGHAGSDSD